MKARRKSAARQGQGKLRLISHETAPLYWHVRRVAQRLLPPTSSTEPDLLTMGDRSTAAGLLRQILDGEDVRELLFEPIVRKGTSRSLSESQAKAVAFLYWLRRSDPDAPRDKVAAHEIAEQVGLDSDERVKHAGKQFKRWAVEYIADRIAARELEHAKRSCFDLLRREPLPLRRVKKAKKSTKITPQKRRTKAN